MKQIEELLDNLKENPEDIMPYFNLPLSISDMIYLENLRDHFSQVINNYLSAAQKNGGPLMLNAIEQEWLVDMLRVENKIIELLSDSPVYNNN